MTTILRSIQTKWPRTRIDLGNLIYYTFLLIVYAAIASTVLDVFMKQHVLRDAQLEGPGNDPNRVAFERQLTHDTIRPFVYRVLTPVTIRVVSYFVPSRLREKLESAYQGNDDSALSEKLVSTGQRYGWGSTRIVERIVTHFILFACLFLIQLLLRYIAYKTYDFSPLFLDFAAPIGLLFLPVSFLCGGYMYDFPEILLALTCLACLMQKRILLYYIFFLLACTNKETGVFTIVYFVTFYFNRMSRIRLLGHCALHVVLGGAIVLGIRSLFSDSGGTPVHHYLGDNIAFFLNPFTYFTFIDTYADMIPFPRSYNIVNLVFAGLVLGYGWNQKPLWARWALCLMLMILTPLYLAFGFRDEIRVFYLAYPMVYLLAVHTLNQVSKRRAHQTTPPDKSLESPDELIPQASGDV